MTVSPDRAPEPPGVLPRAPWVLLDRGTADQITTLLERLTEWLTSGKPKHLAACAEALSIGETDDPATIAHWTDALGGHLSNICHDSDYP